MIKEWQEIADRQRLRVRENPKRSMIEGQAQLESMRMMLEEHEQEWLEALKKDLGKSSFEGYATEFAVLLNELDFFAKNLRNWFKPRKSSRVKLDSLGSRYMIRRPLGTVLIISPWNYPLQLTLMPVIGALSCGNGCFIKPSEHAAATSKLLERLIPKYFSDEWLKVVSGDAVVSKELLNMEWDLVFFTGSQNVGRSVHKQAAEHGTPVVLELGGKNPCIMDRSGFTKSAIEQIVWGKFLNGGQTCVAPDTLYVAEAIYPEVLEQLKKTIIRFYGEHPESNPDYGQMIHAGHAKRMDQLMKDGKVFHGGVVSPEERYVSPTILTDLHEEAHIHEEEIFGPILPIVPYRELTKLVEELPNDEPLAAYVFSKSKRTVQYVADKVRTRALGVNEVITHVADPRLPFGGIGKSGIGTYHGYASIETFSYEQLINREHRLFEAKQKYPPYDIRNIKLLRKLRRWLI